MRFPQVRVNYYVRELYGNPAEFPDPWESPFGIMALKGPTEHFVHPAVLKVASAFGIGLEYHGSSVC